FGGRFESGQDDDPCSRKLGPNRDHSVDAAHIRKPEIHESDIGLVFTKTLDRLASIGSLRYHQHAGLAIDDHGNPFAKESMIVNTENSDGGVHNRLAELVAASSRPDRSKLDGARSANLI